MRRCVVLCLGMVVLAGPALADKASYCQAYARDFSDQLAKDKATWQHKYQIALDACLGSPKQQAVAAAPVKSTPAPPSQKPPVKTQEAAKVPEKPAELPKPPAQEADASANSKPAAKTETKVADGGLIVGSAAWNEYCARKYTSFDPKKGEYLSHTGVMRRCLVTR
jgi:BA14K-like protein